MRPEVTRTGALHVFPSAEREMTTSFAVQPVRKRQSCHAVSTEPLRSSSAAINGGARNGRASRGGQRGDEDGRVERDAAVRRGHRDHPGAARPERQHELAVALDDRDHARDRQLLGHGCRPRAAAVVGALHGELVDAVADQRVGEVAAPPERARRAVVAREPVLVVDEVVRLRDRRVGRAAPRQPVGRAVDRQPVHARCERERVRQPDAVGRVVGEHGVAGAGGRPGRLRDRGQSGQDPLPPRAAAVLRGREADARRAAVPVPPDLEEGDRRRADRLRVGLDLGLVLAVRVREPVAVDPAADDLAAGRTRSRRSAVTMSTAGAAGDVVAAVVVLDRDPVVARRARRPGRARRARAARRRAGVPTSAGRTAAVATAGSATSKRTIATRPRTIAR